MPLYSTACPLPVNRKIFRHRASAPFSPTNLTGLSLWLKADAGITLSGSDVTAWADQSGNGKNATATGTPTLSTVGGKTFIDFSGGYFTGNELITAPYATIMCVAMYSDYQEIGMMFQQFSEADNLAFYRGYADINNFRIYNGVDLNSSSQTNSDETYLFETTVNNDTGTLYLNGSQDANDLCGELTPAGTYYLGRWAGNSLTTTVLKMAEIVVYDRVLSTPERQQVERYLNAKYQIYPLRILISGAGTATSNGEYVWDGVSVGYENKPAYTNGLNNISYNFDMVAYWSLYDDGVGDSAYRSNDLIAWTVDFGSSPAPSATLYYTP